MKKLEVRFTRAPGDFLRVGTLAEDRGRIYFEYDPEFLAAGLNLSPIRLPFEPGLFEHADFDFGPLPGLFDDSLPDGWGLLLMDRHHRSLGVNFAEVSPLSRLAWLGSWTMGSLTYHPPPAERLGMRSDIFDLHKLAMHSEEILSGAAVDVLPQLLRAGGSPGGARPKVLVGFNPANGRIISGEDDVPKGYEHWIVKFSAKTDLTDLGRVEFAYSLMAAAAGIDMPATRLFDAAKKGRFFGIRRFDRAGNGRLHVHTFGGLIQSNFRIPSADYSDLLKTTSFLTRNHKDVLRAYRRMAFNVAVHNRDDHVKNFAFILDDKTGEWTLAPAYDMLHTPGPGGEHSMTILGEGKNPGRKHMLQLAAKAGISKREAGIIIDEVLASTLRWKKFADRACISSAVARQVEASFPDLKK